MAFPEFPIHKDKHGAMELIREVRATIIFSTRRMDAPSQRRVLRHYGSHYRQPPRPVANNEEEE